MRETSVCYRTWKTELWLSVRAEPTDALRRWLRDLLHDEVNRVDHLASRFRPDSQVCAVNRQAGRWTQTSWDFVTVLTASLTAAAATHGMVNPLLGRNLVAAGYDTWAGQDSQLSASTTTADWRDIEIRPGGGQAQVRIPPDSALDLGAVTKGWLADRLALMTHRSTGFDTVANMGGDLRVLSPGRAWVVAADPDIDGVEPVSFAVADAGLATSGVGARSWDRGHHIIDPCSGRPADTCWASVSVMAQDAAGANAAATAGLILGAQGPAWLDRMGLDGWFVGPGGQPAQSTGRWPVAGRRVGLPA